MAKRSNTDKELLGIYVDSETKQALDMIRADYQARTGVEISTSAICNNIISQTLGTPARNIPRLNLADVKGVQGDRVSKLEAELTMLKAQVKTLNQRIATQSQAIIAA